jgi:hypothetical protein
MKARAHLLKNCPLSDGGLNMTEYAFWDQWLNIGQSTTFSGMPPPD